jgi:hypothetical protein
MLKNLQGPEKSVIFTLVKGNKKKRPPMASLNRSSNLAGRFFTPCRQ